MDWRTQTGETDVQWEWQGRLRRTLVYRPEAVRRPAPLVLALHGSGVNGRQMVGFCGLNELADREGFVVAYPEGSGRVDHARTWNAGLCCGHAHRHQIDDVGYLTALLDGFLQTSVEASVEIDPGRIYLTGMSNGAMMSYRFAAERAERIAAIAPVAGPMAIRSCEPARPVPVCHFHGVDDAFTPWNGGKGPRSVSQAEFLSVPFTISSWVEANGCNATPATRHLPVVIDDGTAVLEHRYLGQKPNAEVLLYEIRGAGHVWPGRDSGMEVLGPTTFNIDANEVMWQFFQKFSSDIA